MKTVGKILLFIGGLLFLVAGVLSGVGLIMNCVENISQYFDSAAHIVAFVLAILWIIVDICAGISGIKYAVGRKGSFVKVFAWIILILFIVNVVCAILSITANNDWANMWNYIRDLVYGGVAGICYCLGYFMEGNKKKA